MFQRLHPLERVPSPQTMSTSVTFYAIFLLIKMIEKSKICESGPTSGDWAISKNITSFIQYIIVYHTTSSPSHIEGLSSFMLSCSFRFVLEQRVLLGEKLFKQSNLGRVPFYSRCSLIPRFSPATYLNVDFIVTRSYWKTARLSIESSRLVSNQKVLKDECTRHGFK